MDRPERARGIIRQAERWAFVCGLVPAPLIDATVATIILLRMIAALAELHGIEYDEAKARPLVIALLGALVPTCFGAAIARASLRLLPGVGPVFGLLSTPFSLGGAVRVVGKLFADHFEAGGDLDDFDLRASVVRRPPPATIPDDLTRVDGIGPRIAELLAAAEITTFAELAATDIHRLRALLQRGGPHFRCHDPSTWPAQAQILAGARRA